MIKRMVETFLHMRLASKLILINLVLIALPLTVTGMVSFSGFSASLQRTVGKYQTDVVRELTANLDTVTSEVNLLSAEPYQSPELLKYLEKRRQPGSPATYEERSLLDNFTRKIALNGRVDVIGVSLFSLQGDSYVAFTDSPGSFYQPRIPDQSWYKAASRSGKGSFIGPHEVVSENGVSYLVFSVVRQIRSLENGRTLAFLKIDVDYNNVKDRISLLNGSKENIITITDRNGGIVYQTDPEPELDGIIRELSGLGTVTAGSGQTSKLIAYYTSPLTGWTTVQSVPLRVLLTDTVKVRYIVIGIGVLCLVLATVLSVWMSLWVTKPISLLRNSMKKVEKGKFDEVIPIRSRDEVGQLGHTFNVMVSRLSDLTYRLYESELREKVAKISSLQSQINPHFLYNTLGSISMYAEIGGSREVVDMTHHLSGLLRYSIGNDNSDATLEQELGHVKGYLSIQNIRFEERLSYEFGIPAELLPYGMLRLSLQPLVENAIIHGLEHGRGDVHISIAAARKDDMLLVTVADNGLGMTEQQLQALRVKLDHAPLPDGPGGNGLVNVHRRIVLRFGYRYGLKIESRVRVGTRVIMKLPLLQAADPSRGES